MKSVQSFNQFKSVIQTINDNLTMKLCLTSLVVLLFLTAPCQEYNYRQADSLIKELNKIKEDTGRIMFLYTLAEAYRSAKPDTALIIADQILRRSREIKFIKGEIRALEVISVLHREKGDLPYALETAMKAVRMADENHLPMEQIWGRNRLGNVYIALQDNDKGIFYLKQSDSLLRLNPNEVYYDVTHLLIAGAFTQQGKIDSAEQHLKIVTGKSRVNGEFDIYLWQALGNLEEKKNHFPLALENYMKCIKLSLYEGNMRLASSMYNNVASIYKRTGQTDSAILYAKEGLRYAEMLSYKNRIFTAGKLLAELYEKKDPAEAIRYYKIAYAANDSIYGPRKVLELQATTIKEQERKQETEAAAEAYKNKVRQYLLLGGLAIFFFIAIILFRNNNQKKKAFDLLKKQTAATELQKAKAETALAELKATQAQLIQSEKMASLGELTAGIAHEIQNPLNFVNNFSEVNAELIEELKGERLKAEGERNAALEDELLTDISQNLEKINHHGKRADAIVKGMLQHSRNSSGTKEPTNINALVDEYLRLSYHGLRAKDKSFNAEFKTEFYENIGNINVIPQDIGRVLLNLFTNAFYAVAEKKKAHPDNYEPVVTVTTKKDNGKISIIVKDNGMGIPQKVLDKIFQPFFTTKPTGQGTGLGLSMSYDIIKAHGGELKVETKEGEGAAFIIELPTNEN
jgi:signal transduction histidine kinase